MGNAQEAIEEYEERVGHACRVQSKIVTPSRSIITMILDHEYSNYGKVKYLCQADDGHQKWKKPPEEYNFYWLELVKEYWKNADDDKEPPTWDDPESYL